MRGAIMPGAATPPPDRGALSGLAAGICFIGGIGGANALAPYPRPGASPSQLRQYFTQNAGPTRLNAVGQAISAVSLARFTASVARLAGRAGRGSRTLQAAAIAGGALAAASLAASAACAAALSGRWGRQDASAAALVRREFLAGGVIHTPAFGVLLGAIGLAGLRTGELPRPVAITALASGVHLPAGATVLRRRAPGVVHPGGTVPRPDRQRHRRRPARPGWTARPVSRRHRATAEDTPDKPGRPARPARPHPRQQPAHARLLPAQAPRTPTG